MARQRDPRRKTVEIPTPLHERLKMAAEAQGISTTTAVVLALESWLATVAPGKRYW